MKLNFLTASDLLADSSDRRELYQKIILDLEERHCMVEERVQAMARKVDFNVLKKASFPDGALCGIPVVIKDNICSRGDLTECSSRVLSGFVSPYDATVVSRLKAAGAIIMGKANMDEFAFGSSCESSAFYPTRNPWDLQRVPGGSSGGSAAAVAADEAIAALGSDTGGSIRQPASFCGVVGMKPTYGRVSRYGLIAFASSLDQIGPITKSVRDNALFLKIISGYDEKDSTSADLPVPDYVSLMEKSVKGLRVGLPKEYFVKGLDPEVRRALDQARVVLEDQGVKFCEVSLPHSEYAVAVYYIIATAEASSNLARFDGVQYGLRRPPLSDARDAALISMYKESRRCGFGDEAKRRIILGTYVLSSGYYDAYYLRAQKVRTLIKQDFDRAFQDVDLIMTPTAPTPAFKLKEKVDNPLSMYLSDIYTISVNLAGIPAISVPCGVTQQGLPVGLQVLGKPFAEEDLYRIAYQFEAATSWHKMKPKL